METVHLNDFDREIYNELVQHRRIIVRSLAEKYGRKHEEMLYTFAKLELLGLCYIRTRNKVLLEKPNLSEVLYGSEDIQPILWGKD